MTARSNRVLVRFVAATVVVVLAAGLDLRARADEAEELHDFIQQGMQDWSLTGLAVAVVKDDKVVFIRGYGVRDIRTGAPIDEHSVFQLGSCSKPLTASGVALLVQGGSIKWDTPIVEKWPDFRVDDPSVAKQATLRDILCHRTGVGKDESVLYYAMPITRSELLGRLPEVRQAAPFRTEWRYSNLMYLAAGRVVEQITGESWDEHMAKRIFHPLGMTRTRTTLKPLAQAENVAAPHVRVNDETFVTDFADQDNIGPGASISSSVSDLSQWLLMMVNEGRYQGKQILKPEFVREMVKPQILMPFVDPVHGEHVFDAYGLGLMLRDYHGWRIANHSGMAGHSLAMLGFVPEKRVGVVVLTNHRRCLFHYAVFRRALDLYCDMPPIDIDAANRKLVAELLVRESDSLKRRTATRDPSKKPTLPLEQYRGAYKGQYDLRANLEIEADGLILRYGNFVANVTHWHGDTFRAKLQERRLAAEQDWYLTFTVIDGSITKLHIHSEHDVHADFVPIAESVMLATVALRGSVAGSAEPDPKSLVSQVVTAAGGEEKLLKLFRIRERLNVSPDPEKKGAERVSVLQPPNYWWLGKRERVKEDKEPATFLVWAWTLGALTDPASQVEVIPEVTEADKPALGLRVSGTINPPMDLYFDKAQSRLVRIDWRADIHRFSDWKEHDGAQYPAKCVGYKKASGKPWYFSEIIELERLKELPEGLKR